MKLKALWVRLRAARLKSTSWCGGAAAIAAPWVPLRNAAGVLCGVRHCGATPAEQVRVLLAGPGVFAQSLPVQVCPGEKLCFRVGPARMATSQTLVVRWFDAAGREFLWSAPVL